MLRENYTIIIAVVFVIMSVCINWLSKLSGGVRSHKMNNLYVAISMMLGAVSASTAFGLSASKEYLNLNDKINVRRAEVDEARDRERVGHATIVDKAFIKQDEADSSRARDKFLRGFNCVVLAFLGFVIVLLLALLNKKVVFDD